MTARRIFRSELRGAGRPTGFPWSAAGLISASAPDANRKSRRVSNCNLLPNDLYSDLSNTRRASARDGSETRAVGCHVWRIQIGVIQDIKEFASQLKAHAFPYRERLKQRIINV